MIFSFKFREEFNMLDYQFSNENKPLQIPSISQMINYDDTWSYIKKIFKPVLETSQRKIARYIDPPTLNIVEIPKEAPKPKLIDYQFSEFNFPSFPLNSMKITPHRPWTDTKQVDKYIIPQTLTPYATNLYEV